MCRSRTVNMECLLRAGAAVDAAALNGDTALHLSAKLNNVPAVRKLLDHGADVHAKDQV